MSQGLDLKHVIASTVIIGAIGYKLFIRYKKHRIVDIDPSHVIRLLPREKKQFNVQAISTITYYEGDSVEAIKFLRKRIADIISANPWLGGRLVTLNGEVVLHFDTKDHPECFKITEEVDSVKIKSLQDYLEWSKHPTFTAGKLKRNKYLLDNPDAPIFQVSLTPIKGGKFAVLSSMCHAIGDGYTFYMINNMMSESATIFTLEEKRVSSFTASVKQLIGEEEYSLLNFSIPLMIGAIRNRLRKHNMSFMEIDQGHNMEKVKQEAAKGVPFVSTNDIITSAFFNAANISFGGMATNCRGRVSEIHERLAGNYANGISYRKADFCTPSLIRKSLQTMRRASSPPTTLPNWVELVKGRFGIISNWSTFYKDVNIPNAKLIMHYPLLFGNPPSVPGKAIAILFRPQEGRLALLSTIDLKPQLGNLIL